MKKLPEVNESFEELYGMLLAPIQSKLLLTAIEMKVFDQLSEHKSAEAVADVLGTQPENTRLFLDGLAASDLLVKTNGLYRNTPVTQTFLVEGSPTYLGQLFMSQSQFYYSILDDLPKLVKEGSPPPTHEADLGDEEMWKQVAVGFANSVRAGLAQWATGIVSNLPEFPKFRKMLDLGSGPGIYAIAFVASHPGMKGVIFDRSAIVEVAENFIKEYGMEGRIEVIVGDYNHDPIGKGYDLIWASNTLNFARQEMDALMKKVHDALNPGGVFISFCEGLTHERTKPDTHVLCMTSMALMGQDMCFDQGEISDSMLRMGFKSVRSRTLETDWGPMDLDIGRRDL